MLLRFQTACRLFLLAALVTSGVAVGQDSSARIGSEYIPGDAMVTVVLSVADTLRSPSAEMYPTEIADAWCEQNFGVPARDIDQIKVVVSAPGPGEPMFAAIISSRSNLDIGSLNPDFVNTTEAIDVDDHACYAVVGPPGVVLHAKDARTVIIASENYLDTILRSADPSDTRGPLAKMAATVPHNGNLTALIAIEPIRPMAMGMLQAQADQIPPPLAPFTKIPQLLDAILLRVNLEDQQNGLNLVMLGRDEAAAEELLGIISNGLQMGRQIGLAQAMRELPDDDPLAEASRQYAIRMSNMIVEMLTPTRDGRRLTLSGSATQGVATQGVLVALLLPAVQSARQAARRMSSSNNLKMIALAMHNYHDTYQHFPTDIHSSDGKPLLSWRVAILPFIEEAPLYEQFHLDEPWDSPHNLALAQEMPLVYLNPGVATAPGMTVYQRPAGENFIMNGAAEIGFRDITDGTSNTIMGVEALGDAAVPWTKPSDLEIDPDNPMANLVDTSRQGFNAMFGDGSVRFITNSIDPEVFKAMLTRNGGEIIRP